MREYRVEISLTDGEQSVCDEVYIEAESFEEAVAIIEKDLDISLEWKTI